MTEHEVREYTFEQLPYSRPDVTAITLQSREIADAIITAPNAQTVIDAVDRWNDLRNAYSTMQSLAEVHYTQDVSNAESKAEKEFFDNVSPSVAEAFQWVSLALINSTFKDAVAALKGELFIRRLSDSHRVFSPAVKDLLTKESAITNEYNELTASAQINVNGTSYNLSTLGKLMEDPNREIRVAAQKALNLFLKENGPQFDSLYHSLVQIRTEMAQKLGFQSYTQMRYVEMGRVDYTREDIEEYRNAVIKYVVPLATDLRNQQAKRLGLENLTIADEKLQFPDGNPTPRGTHAEILQAARTMYNELHPETGSFFEMMLSRNLLDLHSRNNKAPGGYCTSFASYKIPFIFANFNNTTHDVEVLTHEAGHAFQSWRSRNYDVPEYQWPTMESCEIHSMAMEYFTAPWMHLFFGDQTDRFLFMHLQGAILFLPYGCMVDEFQHWVYDHPEATPDERRHTWQHLEKTYMPWRNRTDDALSSEGRAWQLQRHIYESPFYYIDYTLASICALQYNFWAIEDIGSAFDSYLSVCDLGGSMPFLDIVRSGNLSSPFDPGTLPAVISKTEKWLRDHCTAYIWKSES